MPEGLSVPAPPDTPVVSQWNNKNIIWQKWYKRDYVRLTQTCVLQVKVNVKCIFIYSNFPSSFYISCWPTYLTRLWAYLVKVIPETRRVHWIVYQCCITITGLIPLLIDYYYHWTDTSADRLLLSLDWYLCR